MLLKLALRIQRSHKIQSRLLVRPEVSWFGVLLLLHNTAAASALLLHTTVALVHAIELCCQILDATMCSQ